MSGPLTRIGAMVRRNYYLLRGSGPRFLETIVWPSIEIMIWGFVSVYFSTKDASVAVIGQMALTGALLWQVFVRGQMATVITFLEEMWSRNFGHLFVTPLRPWEFVAGIYTVAALRMSLGVGFACILATILFASQIFDLGLVLVPYFALLLMMSWWLGAFIMGVIFRYGMAVEWLIWMVGFLLLPFSCVFYPLSTLPEWLHPLALAIPATHIFEGVRSVMSGGAASGFLWAFLLNLLYLALAGWFLMRSLNYARANAMLVQQGE
jgi:ABC-2 type transport system permease protein